MHSWNLSPLGFGFGWSCSVPLQVAQAWERPNCGAVRLVGLSQPGAMLVSPPGCWPKQQTSWWDLLGRGSWALIDSLQAWALIGSLQAWALIPRLSSKISFPLALSPQVEKARELELRERLEEQRSVLEGQHEEALRGEDAGGPPGPTARSPPSASQPEFTGPLAPEKDGIFFWSPNFKSLASNQV